MSAHPVALARRLRERIESGSARHGLLYPWWIAVSCSLLQVGAALLALQQRSALLTPALATVALVAAPHVAQIVLQRWVPWWVTASAVVAAAVWLLQIPPSSPSGYDFAPAILAVMVAGVTATDAIRPGLAATAASLATLLVATWPRVELGNHVGEVLLGFFVGAMLRWQMRALAAEQAARDEDLHRAKLEERQRIAREIHDLVGHALSVTLLHVTGARRALTEDADIAEAVDALRDAERIGRQAMSDIRGTVSVLATGPSPPQALPGGADIARLAADARAAGLEVDYVESGDLAAVPPAVGLGLYRVMQESLANALKHAPGAPVEARLEVADGAASLEVRNPLPARTPSGPAARRAGGIGLAGMDARADQLGGSLLAGPDAGSWVVRLTVPAAEATGTAPPPGTPSSCVVRRVLP